MNYVYAAPTPADRLQSAADGIKHVASTLESDPVRACELLTALSGHLQWIAQQIEEKRSNTFTEPRVILTAMAIEPALSGGGDLSARHLARLNWARFNGP